MKTCILLLLAALSVYWQITAAIIVPEETNDGEESERIVRGKTAKPGQFPFAVALNSSSGGDYELICTGSIISPNFVLTAAHCVVSNEMERSTIKYRVIANVDRTAASQVRDVNKVIVHPDYNSENFTNDIAVLKLDKSLQFSKYVSSVTLDKTKRDTDCMGYEEFGPVCAIGFGNTVGFPKSLFPWIFRPDYPRILQYGKQNVVCRQNCPFAVNKKQMCATGKLSLSPGNITFWSAVCDGDSGGPLIEMPTSGMTKQVGLTSYGTALGCGLGIPEVFTRISAFLDFIDENSNSEATYG